MDRLSRRYLMGPKGPRQYQRRGGKSCPGLWLRVAVGPARGVPPPDAPPSAIQAMGREGLHPSRRQARAVHERLAPSTAASSGGRTIIGSDFPRYRPVLGFYLHARGRSSTVPGFPSPRTDPWLLPTACPRHGGMYVLRVLPPHPPPKALPTVTPRRHTPRVGLLLCRLSLPTT